MAKTRSYRSTPVARRALVGLNVVVAAATCATILAIPIAYGDPEFRAALPGLFADRPLYLLFVIFGLEVIEGIINACQHRVWGRVEALPAPFWVAIFFLLFALFALIVSISGLFTDALVGWLPAFGVFTGGTKALSWFLRAVIAYAIGQGYLLRCMSFTRGFDGDADGD